VYFPCVPLYIYGMSDSGKDDVLDFLFETTSQGSLTAEPLEPLFPPPKRQLGVTECPVCSRNVSVFLTKTHRPFIRCGYCSVLIFYNGTEGVSLLQRRMIPVIPPEPAEDA
jgi:DNA-directed RNA polymerase subunit RPC12/RpoP